MDFTTIVLILLSIACVTCTYLLMKSRQTVNELTEKSKAFQLVEASLRGEVDQVLKDLETTNQQRTKEKELHIELKKSYERILSAAYFKNKDIFNNMDYYIAEDNVLVVRSHLPSPPTYLNGCDPVQELNVKVKRIDLININLIQDQNDQHRFVITQGRNKKAILSIGSDFALLPEPPEELVVRLSKEVLGFIHSNKYYFNH